MSKLALFHGCWGEAGHYLFDKDHRTVWRDRLPPGLPWNDGHMDNLLVVNASNKKDITDGRVFWTCGGRAELWFAFVWWDRSGDSRPNSNSGFYVRGFGPDPLTPETAKAAAGEAFAFACAEFPKIVARQHFPLCLVEYGETSHTGKDGA